MAGLPEPGTPDPSASPFQQELLRMGGSRAPAGATHMGLVPFPQGQSICPAERKNGISRCASLAKPSPAAEEWPGWQHRRAGI